MNVRNENGQAIFEFIIFLPFLLILLSITITISSSINGSINQQKITRGYFFHRVKGNSTIPSPQEMDGFSVKKVSMRFVGWAEKMDGAENDGSPYATCYKMTKLLGIGGNRECDDSLPGDGTTSIIKPRTVFGICTNTFENINDQYQHRLYDSGCSYE